MYEYIKGTLTDYNAIYAVIETGGVGYKILIPVNLNLILGKQTLLYTSWVVRETFSQLFGFLEKEERNLFELLLSFSGIGPKTALSIIGHLSRDDLQQAVISNNVSQLTKIPGIGKKTAERLMVDLKGKLNKSSTPFASSQKIQDATYALINLGYSQDLANQSIRSALDEVSNECDLSTLISAALKVKKRI